MLTLDEFAGDQFLGYIENVPPARNYILSRFMPIEPVFDLKFAYNVIDKKYGRTASITGFNSDAPLRDKDGLSQAFAEVSKVQHGFRVDEYELLRFANPRREEERQKAIDYVYNQTDNLIQGVYDIEEWMRAQAMYKGRLDYSENDVVISVDYQIPAANKMVAATSWTDINSNPLVELQAVVTQFKNANKGEAPAEIHVSSKVKNDLLKSKAVILQVYGDADSRRLISNADLTSVLENLDLPPIVVQDTQIDNGKGLERLLPERRVVALGGGEVGKLYCGPTVEKNFDTGMYVLPIIETKQVGGQAVLGRQ